MRIQAPLKTKQGKTKQQQQQQQQSGICLFGLKVYCVCQKYHSSFINQKFHEIPIFKTLFFPNRYFGSCFFLFFLSQFGYLMVRFVLGRHCESYDRCLYLI